MRKGDFLAKADVAAFVDWLAIEITRTDLTHEYRLPDGKARHFRGLAEALDQYSWSFQFEAPGGRCYNGSTFGESATALAALKQGLTANMPPNEPNDDGVRDWSCAVMKWGGVTSGNVRWLKDNVVGLSGEIERVQALLQKGDDDPAVLGAIHRFNAGMTKVYSLLVDDFVIYDSRVAAALAWLVATWCASTGRKTVPDLLAFRLMPPKEGEDARIRKSRDPSCGTLEFRQLNGNAREHARWNLRASWVLGECLRRSKLTVFHEPGKGLRALEAALFMWGYDLAESLPCEKPTGEDGGEPVSSAEPDDDPAINPTSQAAECREGWREGVTLGGKRRRFCWTFDVDRDALIIDRPNLAQEVFTSTEIFCLLHCLYDQFGYDWFGLANNVQALNDGTEKPGLGSTIYQLSRNIPHAQASSQLGPILMHFRLFEWNDRVCGIAWRLREPPAPTIDALRMVLAG